MAEEGTAVGRLAVALKYKSPVEDEEGVVLVVDDIWQYKTAASHRVEVVLKTQVGAEPHSKEEQRWMRAPAEKEGVEGGHRILLEEVPWPGVRTAKGAAY